MIGEYWCALNSGGRVYRTFLYRHYWFKKAKRGSKLYDKEVLLIIHGLYRQIFLKLRDRGFQILIIALGKNNAPKSGARVYWTLWNSNFWSKQIEGVLDMIPRTFYRRSIMFTTKVFPNLRYRGPQILIIKIKWSPPKWPPSKMQTYGATRLKEGLK